MVIEMPFMRMAQRRRGKGEKPNWTTRQHKSLTVNLFSKFCNLDAETRCYKKKIMELNGIVCALRINSKYGGGWVD